MVEGKEPTPDFTYRRLVQNSASTSALSSPSLLRDANAPQPDSGWRIADSLAELGLSTTGMLLLMLGRAARTGLAQVHGAAPSRLHEPGDDHRPNAETEIANIWAQVA